jgi:hypothetical protein
MPILSGVKFLSCEFDCMINLGLHTILDNNYSYNNTYPNGYFDFLLSKQFEDYEEKIISLKDNSILLLSIGKDIKKYVLDSISTYESYFLSKKLGLIIQSENYIKNLHNYKLGDFADEMIINGAIDPKHILGLKIIASDIVEAKNILLQEKLTPNVIKNHSNLKVYLQEDYQGNFYYNTGTLGQLLA